MASKPFRERYPEFIKGEETQPTVLFFTGCGINYMYPGSGDALIKALKFLGVNIIIPKDQVCCGLPAVSAGATDTVEQLAADNQKMFAAYDYDYVVTACASCHSGLTQIYPAMSDGDSDYAEKVKDIFVFLVEQGFADKLNQLPESINRSGSHITILAT